MKRLILGLAVATAVLLPAGAAVAAPQANIDHVEVVEGDTVQMLLGVDDLPAGVAPDLASISVSVSGDTVDATAEQLAEGAIKRVTVLALDTSLSMNKNGRFAAAKSAAQTFLSAAPDDVFIGLVTFDGTVQTVAEPTTDHEAVSTTIDDLELKLGTRLYAGIADAVVAAGTDGARSVLVLSDGANADPETSIETAIGAAEEASVKVDVVALQQSAENRALLTRISDAANGTLLPADDPKALNDLFAAEAAALTRQMLVEFTKPEGVGTEASIEASIMANGQTYTDSAFVRLAGKAAPGPKKAAPQVVTTASPLIDERGLLLGGVALALGLAGILVIVLARPKPQASLMQRQMEHLSGKYNDAQSAPKATSANMRQSAMAVADTLVRRGDFETTLHQRISAAGLTLTASEWMLMHIGVAVLGGLVGILLGGGVLMVVLFALGLAAPWFYLNFKRSRRIGAFNGQLAETLQLISGGLSAGLSLPQAVDTAVREGNDPMAGELRRALIEQRLGVDIEDALDGVADRMASDDFRWVVMAIRIQREVGGNLAELLETVAATLREREYLRRQVKVLSAEGRISAWILGGLPVGMCIYLATTRPEYLRPMYTEPLGWALSFAAVVMLGIGAFAMSKMVKVEV